jgi:hypothetical protein
MKKIVDQLKSYIQYYPIWYWVLMFAFCTFSVYINYAWGLQAYMDTLHGLNEYGAYVLLYAVHSLFAFILYALVSRSFGFLRKPGFWLVLVLGFMIFAFRAVTWQHLKIIDYFSVEWHYYINHLVYNDIFRFLYLCVPVAIVWFFRDKKEMPLYGFSGIGHQQKVYWILLLCMVPLIAGASMLSDFLDYYPRLRKINNAGGTVMDMLTYELFYGMDFVSIELFFRGFMVMAFIRYLGPHAILPMAAFYMSIHYGKPMGEAISSFFGGTILGVLAFHSRSIYGGIMVHMGIAWLMELGGFLGNWIRGTW